MWTSSDLQFLQPGLGLLPLGQIPDETGEETSVARFHFTDRELHRKRRSVLALAHHHAADADDAALPGRQVALQVAVVTLAVGGGHQHLDVLCQDFRRVVAEQSFGGGTERLHDSTLVDDHHGIGYRVENRLDVGLACQRLLIAGGEAEPAAMELLSAPRHARSDRGECRCAGKFGQRQERESRREQQAERHRQGGCDKPGAESADNRCREHGWHEKQEAGFIAQHRREQCAGGERERDRRRRNGIAPCDRDRRQTCVRRGVRCRSGGFGELGHLHFVRPSDSIRSLLMGSQRPPITSGNPLRDII